MDEFISDVFLGTLKHGYMVLADELILILINSGFNTGFRRVNVSHAIADSEG